jgi:hypothetical protein
MVKVRCRLSVGVLSHDWLGMSASKHGWFLCISNGEVRLFTDGTARESCALNDARCHAKTLHTNHARLRAVFHAGPSQAMNFFTTTGTGGHRAAGTRPGGDQMNGNAVMYASGKILCVGGSKDYEGSPMQQSSVATTAASIITITAPASGDPVASSRAVAPMQFARAFSSSVVLPDGKVVVIGGMPYPALFKDNNAIMHSGTACSAQLCVDTAALRLYFSGCLLFCRLDTGTSLMRHLL